MHAVIHRRLTQLELRQRPRQRIIIRWEDGSHTEGAQPVTLAQIQEAEASGWQVVVIKIIYDD